MDPYRRIWIYWENPPGQTKPPPYIDLCWQTLRKHSTGCTITLVTPENVSDYLPDLPKEANTVSLKKKPGETCIALKCDVIRCLLLEKYGGLYIDSDAIVLKDLAQIFELLQQWEFVGLRRTSAKARHIPVNFYGTKPRGKIITAYANRLRRLISERSQFAWADLGAWALTPIVNENLADCFLFPENAIHPIVAEEQDLFLSESAETKDYLANDPIVFMLFHRTFSGEIGRWPQERLMSSNILLSKLFRHALQAA